MTPDPYRNPPLPFPTLASVREEAVWGAAFVRHLSGGGAEAWKHADLAVEAYRDRLQHAEMERARIPSEEGPAHV
ncbi:MAG: hypothetical protein ACRCZP_19775 [Phycicoccus sp.]